jgi:DNA-binding protein YbaB
MVPDAEQRAANMAAQAEALRERLRLVSGEWTSPDGSVSVRVGPNGVPVALTIADKALALGARRLTQAVMEGFRQAGERAGEQAREAVADMVGEPMNPEDLLRG